MEPDASSDLPPVPSSPVYSLASTANPMSHFNLPPPPAPRPGHAVLTGADLERSHEAYADLVASAKAYRLALASLSSAASSFGSALESCARLKEARAEPVAPTGAVSAGFAPGGGACTADTLLSASGVHHLVANHQQILSDTVYRAFEVPLLHDLDRWRCVIDDEADTYQQKIKAQSREVKRLEKEGLQLHRQRRRDVGRFRAHLVDLTAKLDGLTSLHADHARALLRESQETSARIVDASCSLVRAEVDIFESLARKGWTGGGLDDLLEKGQDLFAFDDAHAASAAASSAATAAGGVESPALFSILPPRSILADTAHDAAPTRSDSMLTMDGGQGYRNEATDGTDAGDDDFPTDLCRPRGPRPFSPQPLRRVPADVTIDSLAAMGLAASPEGFADDDGFADETIRGRPGSRRSRGRSPRDGSTTPPSLSRAESASDAESARQRSPEGAE
ncbi:hypothetical protein DCS_00109 [Drechmeria coniospora]|uniref:Phospholipid-binding protein n=1 Tax=Drechmeria coniospora TaxID=98403 RepID=A0A151GPQ1_DRECN|nr:hypothetical protein DCS_00109 [Drechmeria coniospora]KYK58982.1 hypothetical protein DCS_00109 [Drechmeria coniospora]